jgi:hypothetical protein
MAGEEVRDEWQGKRCGMTRGLCDAIIEGQGLGINLLFFVSAAAASCACSLRSKYNRNMNTLQSYGNNKQQKHDYNDSHVNVCRCRRLAARLCPRDG